MNRKKAYSNDIAAAVKQYMDDDDWNYFFDEDSGIFRFAMKIRSMIQRIEYRVHVGEDWIVFYGNCPVGADCDDAEMMRQMAEFIVRANYGILNGCFELDFRDGEIRYKSFVDCDGVLPSKEVIMDSINVMGGMYQRYAPGILDIIFGGCSAEEAIAKCEGTTEAELRSLFSKLSESAEGANMERLLVSMAERLGFTESDDDDDAEKGTEQEGTDICVDLFSQEDEE